MHLIKKIYIALLISLPIGFYSLPTNGNENLPELGTVANQALTIDQEKILGDIYMRMLRRSEPIVQDPILNDYIKELGDRLVAHASNVKTPFHFFLLNNNQINAFAFFGGYIGIHTGLFLVADTESELASVFAHEIAHITQRHLARALEENKKKQPLTIASIIGSVLLAIAAPEAGIAALATTGAVAKQSQINYTRSNEEEADSLGIQTLVRADFNPQGAPMFFNKLAEKYRFSSRPPQILLTHPLPESRIANAQNRANQYPNKKYYETADFLFAKVKIEAFYSPYNNDALLLKFKERAKSSLSNKKNAALYGQALILLRTEKYKDSEKILANLLKKQPENLFYLDAYSDVLIQLKQFKKGIDLLTKQHKNKPKNRVITINLAHTYLKAKQPKKAIPLLENLTITNKNDILTYSILMIAYQQTSQEAKHHVAHANVLALKGEYTQAIQQLKKADYFIRDNENEHAIIKEKIRQLQKKQKITNELR